MSAFIAVRKRTQIDILADGAHYTRDGVLTEIAPKVYPVPNMRAVIFGRGKLDVHRGLVAGAAGRVRTFDALADTFPALLADVLDVLDAMAPGEYENSAEIVLAGWSESRRRPELWFCGAGPDAEFGPVERPVLWAPKPDLEYLRTIRFSAASGDPERFDAVRHGVPLMEAQRRVRSDETSPQVEPGVYAIGGHVLHTRVSEAGIESRILKVWPDEIGKLIVPDPVQAPLTRQQRRAEQRRKAVA